MAQAQDAAPTLGSGLGWQLTHGAENSLLIHRTLCRDNFDDAVNGTSIHRMKSGDKSYIWQLNNWPHWTYDHKHLASLLAKVHRAQGHLLGLMHDLGMDLPDQATLRVLTDNVLTTSEIEGERLEPA